MSGPHVIMWITGKSNPHPTSRITLHQKTPIFTSSIFNNFYYPDALIRSISASNENYEGSGYDRGHLVPSADMCCSYQTMDDLIRIAAFNWLKDQVQLHADVLPSIHSKQMHI